MGWRKRSQRLDLPSRRGRPEGLRRRLGGFGPFGLKASRVSPQMPLASDAGRRAVAVARVNVETWRGNAYQAYWRTQVR